MTEATSGGRGGLCLGVSRSSLLCSGGADLLDLRRGGFPTVNGRLLALWKFGVVFGPGGGVERPMEWSGTLSFSKALTEEESGGARTRFRKGACGCVYVRGSSRGKETPQRDVREAGRVNPEGCQDPSPDDKRLRGNRQEVLT